MWASPGRFASTVSSSTTSAAAARVVDRQVGVDETTVALAGLVEQARLDLAPDVAGEGRHQGMDVARRAGEREGADHPPGVGLDDRGARAGQVLETGVVVLRARARAAGGARRAPCRCRSSRSRARRSRTPPRRSPGPSGCAGGGRRRGGRGSGRSRRRAPWPRRRRRGCAAGGRAPARRPGAGPGDRRRAPGSRCARAPPGPARPRTAASSDSMTCATPVLPGGISRRPPPTSVSRLRRT